MKTVVTLGEIMMRLCPPGLYRFSQSLPGTLEATFAGAEANVAAAITALGGKARFVTALPDNPLGHACAANLSAVGVDTSQLSFLPDRRLGVYYVERGANQRASQVLYDRNDAALNSWDAGAIDWEAVFSDAEWLHLTGITPALSAAAAALTSRAMEEAGKRGMPVSFDLNYRKMLWRWNPACKPVELARKTLRPMLDQVSLLITNEEDAAELLDIRLGKTDLKSGRLEAERYAAVAREAAAQFRNLQMVAVTLRESISASHNNWGGMLYQAADDKAYYAPLDPDGNYQPYPIRNIVDRVGTGDAFAGALLFALHQQDLKDPDSAVQFAAAASCLAHSIEGDFNRVTRAEVDALRKGFSSGRVVR